MSSKPKEYQLDAKWDRFFDLSIRRLVWGAGSAGLASLLFLRGGNSRAIVTAFGAGIGLGSAWQQASKDFEELVPELVKGQ